MKTLTALLLVFSLVLAGCGGDDGGDTKKEKEKDKTSAVTPAAQNVHWL